MELQYMLDSINDKCWAMLDWLWDRGIPIGSFFEKYELPPILFPLVIVLALLLVFWIVAMPAGPSCGDNYCDPETEACNTCEIDCGKCQAASTGLTLTVELIGQVKEPVTVTIYDKDNNKLHTETNRNTIFEFTDMESQIVKAVVECPYGKEQSSRPRTLDAENKVIELWLPEDCFEGITDIEGNPMKTHGNVIAEVTDASTGADIDGAIVTAIRLDDDLAEESQTAVDGEATLHLRADVWYYLTVLKAGYEGYDGDRDKFYMIGGDTVIRNVRLTPLISREPARLKVCATSQGATMDSGRLAVMELGGLELASATLAPADRGCITFDLDPGILVKAVLVSPPSGCVASSYPSTVVTEPGSEKRIDLDVECGETAFVKVVVHKRDGTVVTDEVTVTLWNAVTGEQIPGTALDASLSMGSGGYTEEITVPANTFIKAKATGAPLGFIDTESGPVAITPGDSGSIDIVLGESARGGFEFMGASIVYTPAAPGTPIQVFVQQISFNKTMLTDENSQVKVTVNGVEYDAVFLQ